MKLMIGAAAAAVLLATPAMAQTTALAMPASCSGFEPAPALIDGATATRAQMTETNDRLQAWRVALDAKRATCQADINALRAQLDAAVAAHNAVVDGASAHLTAWNAEVTEFNARGNTGGDAQTARTGRSRTD